VIYKCRILHMNAIQEAIATFPSVSGFARAVGVTPQAACFWRDGKRKVPAERCPTIERLTGVACERLCPDADWGFIRTQALANTAPQAIEAIAGQGV
jgi:DNA-binding transcriptional regulator YdaS (Cro superfamily)